VSLFDGLDKLRGVALVGYEALREATARPIVWRWQGIAADGHHVEISGPAGGGKTTLASLLIVALANAGANPVKVLGHEVVPIRAGAFVVLIEEENGTHSVRTKLETACDALGLDVASTLDRVVVIVRKNVHMGDEVWEQLSELGSRGGLGAVVIDSRARVLRQGESNSEDDQALVAGELFRLIDRARGPVFVISHTRKGTAAEIEDVSGSAQRGAAADVVVLVTPARNKNGRVVSATVAFAKIRDDVEEHPAQVTFSIVKDDEGRWTLSETSARPSEDRAPPDARILGLLSKQDRAVTKNVIRMALKMNMPTSDEALARLCSQGQVDKSTAMVSGKRREVFALRRDRTGGAQ
jgi:hypothetical protein